MIILHNTEHTECKHYIIILTSWGIATYHCNSVIVGTLGRPVA